jgi:hypothetical protein
MTLEEYRLVLGCLHPDKHPKESADEHGRYASAFAIFKRLEETIPDKLPIATSRSRLGARVQSIQITSNTLRRYVLGEIPQSGANLSYFNPDEPCPLAPSAEVLAPPTYPRA